MLIEKTFQKIQEGIVPTEEEIMNNYNENKNTLYSEKSLDEAKEDIIKSLKEQKGMEEYLKLLEKIKVSAKIEDISQEYQGLVEKTEIEKDGFVITNVDLAKRTLNMFLWEI